MENNTDIGVKVQKFYFDDKKQFLRDLEHGILKGIYENNKIAKKETVNKLYETVDESKNSEVAKIKCVAQEAVSMIFNQEYFSKEFDKDFLSWLIERMTNWVVAEYLHRWLNLDSSAVMTLPDYYRDMIAERQEKGSSDQVRPFRRRIAKSARYDEYARTQFVSETDIKLPQKRTASEKRERGKKYSYAVLTKNCFVWSSLGQFWKLLFQGKDFFHVRTNKESVADLEQAYEEYEMLRKKLLEFSTSDGKRNVKNYVWGCMCVRDFECTHRLLYYARIAKYMVENHIEKIPEGVNLLTIYCARGMPRENASPIFFTTNLLLNQEEIIQKAFSGSAEAEENVLVCIHVACTCALNMVVEAYPPSEQPNWNDTVFYEARDFYEKDYGMNVFLKMLKNDWKQERRDGEEEKIKGMQVLEKIREIYYNDSYIDPDMVCTIRKITRSFT